MPAKGEKTSREACINCSLLYLKQSFDTDRQAKQVGSDWDGTRAKKVSREDHQTPPKHSYPNCVKMAYSTQ